MSNPCKVWVLKDAATGCVIEISPTHKPRPKSWEQPIRDGRIADLMYLVHTSSLRALVADYRAVMERVGCSFGASCMLEDHGLDIEAAAPRDGGGKE